MRSQSASVASRNERAGVHAGAVDEDVDPAGLLQRGGQQVLDRLARGDVDRAEAGLAAELFEGFDAGLAAFLGQIGDDHVGAGLGQAGAQRPAQHARPADDDGRLAGESEKILEIIVTT